MRKVLGLSTLSLCFILLVQSLFSQAAGTVRYVSNTSPTCNGQSPCYATIQAAVNAAQPGDAIRIQAGEYASAVVVRGKNNTETATEADRIILEADPAAPQGSVILGTTDPKCVAGANLQIESSQFITIRGLTIAGGKRQALTLAGGPKKSNAAIHIERNRILGNGTCKGGLFIGKDNGMTLVANNLIYGNSQYGVNVQQGGGGPHYLIGNAIHGNGRSGVYIGKDQEVWLVNNLITGNGTDPKKAARDGFGVNRKVPKAKALPELAVLLHNLICGNAGGELNGTMLDGSDAGNLTPNGNEGTGVSASPGCDNLATLYANLNGADAQPNTRDDDFSPADASPAIDQGIDPRTLGASLPASSLEADFLSEAARPQDGGGGVVFDIGAIEKEGSGGSGCTPGEERACYDGPAGTEGVGICHAGTQTCLPEGVFGPCIGQVLPGTEIPNNDIDEDCNGQDAECSPGASQSCYTGPAGTEGVGICQAGTETCDSNGVFGACEGQVLPGTEIPGNGVDEDCDGEDETSGGGGLPPDPETVAPPVAQGVATTIGAATEFLYTGTNPIQTGVAPGTIEPKRAAVIRGKVLDRNNAPLSGVKITILNHSEFGYTLSRADGMFDMAVNGGGLLTFNYEKVGFLPAQRQVNAPWQDFAFAPDVVLLPLDPNVTVVDLTSPNMSVARGSTVSDDDGARQATLLVPPGTTAELVMPDGTTQPITNLSIRATEYTVGPNGPKAMPGDLPPTSGYTYAVEYSVDAALAVGAKEVKFNQPLFHYVENFLGFPVGMIVPTGYYDRDKGIWIPSLNGRVVKIASITNGLADLTGLTADDSPVSNDERQRLAQLYAAGQELWRVPISHFTPWDCNWGVVPPPDATTSKAGEPRNEQKTDCVTKKKGSIIGCQDQTLGEAVGVTGTPFALHYTSDRVPGRVSDRTLLIPLSSTTVPPSLKRIELEVKVAGQQLTQSFPPAANQNTTFTWDRKDTYGRELQGSQSATVRVGYVYDAVYQQPAERRQSFAAFSGIPITGNRARQELTLWQEYRANLFFSMWNQMSEGLGGWDLTVHHDYDPTGKVLYQGDGSRRSVNGTNAGGIISRFAGGNICGPSGNGIPATEARVGNVGGIAVGPDGSVYFTDNQIVRKVSPNGIITTVAGTGQGGFSGDGGPAIQARFNFPGKLTVGPDGSLYIVDNNNNRVRKVSPDGIITTIVGTGLTGFSGDDGPATLARITTLNSGAGITIGSDDSLYISDYGNNRVRKISPDGIITTVVGNGQIGFSGDNGPATQAKLFGPGGVAIDPNGNLYVADFGNRRVRKVSPNGIITTVAGQDFSPSAGTGDGGNALMANVLPYDVEVSVDGTLYIAERAIGLIRKVTRDDIITTVAGGGGVPDYSSDGSPATTVRLSRLFSIVLDREGNLLSDRTCGIQKVSPVYSGFVGGDIAIPSEDGTLLYRFSPTGRHLKTLYALTGAMLYEFFYDTAGRLIQVKDGDNNITTIERDGSGNPTAIVGPFGQRTTLTVDTNGYLASIANPAGETHRFTYTAGGLMTAMQDPKNNAYQFTYDTLGRLIRDDDPAGGNQALSRVELGDTGFPAGNSGASYEVTRTTGLGRATKYRVGYPSAGPLAGAQTREIMTNTFPNSTTSTTTSRLNGMEDTVAPDGTTATMQEGPDPRFGMQAPVTTSGKITTPGNLILNATGSRTITPANPSDPFNFTSLTDTAAINNRTYTSTYTKATRTFSNTTPQNRTSTTTIDTQGRLTQATIPGLATTAAQYDTHGRLASISQGTGVDARTVTFTYRPDGYLDAVTDPLGREVSFEYDAVGRVTSQTLPDGRVVGYTYDANGNVTSITPPGRPAHEFTYTAIDLQQTYLPPNTQPPVPDPQTQYSYNIDRQLELITRPDGKTIQLDYDTAGRVQTQTIERGQYGYTYNATTGNLQNISAPGSIGLAYTYDGSLLKDTTWTGAVAGSVNRTYDNNFRVTALRVNSANPINLTYDNDSLLTGVGSMTLSRNAQNGLLTGSTLGNATDTLTYNAFGELDTYTAKYSGADMYKNTYTRDKLGRIITKTETIGGVTTAYEYLYDLAGRLAEVKQNGVTTATYTYDANGNRLTGPSAATTYTYDDQDRLLTQSSTLSPQSFAYTANGELITKTNTSTNASTTYTYDELGNLISVTLPNGTQLEYVIDGQNRRIGKKVNGALVQGFLYQSQLRPIAELNSSGAIVSRFIYGTHVNVPDYMITYNPSTNTSTGTYRIITDHLGSVRLVVNTANGAIAQRMDYDEFGSVLADTNPGFQPFGFAGGFYDRDTKFVRFGARDYDAATGRWTAKDPIGFRGRQVNLYQYAYSDPANWNDTNGGAPSRMRRNEINRLNKCPLYEPVLDPSRRDRDYVIGGTGGIGYHDRGYIDRAGCEWGKRSPGLTAEHPGRTVYNRLTPDGENEYECSYVGGILDPTDGSFNIAPTSDFIGHGVLDYLPYKLGDRYVPTSYIYGDNVNKNLLAGPDADDIKLLMTSNLLRNAFRQ